MKRVGQVSSILFWPDILWDESVVFDAVWWGLNEIKLELLLGNVVPEINKNDISIIFVAEILLVKHWHFESLQTDIYSEKTCSIIVCSLSVSKNIKRLLKLLSPIKFQYEQARETYSVWIIFSTFFSFYISDIWRLTFCT